MRLLLLSDTHGHLDQIDALAARVGADAVLHAGDFGFYDDDSVDRLEARELFLRVLSALPEPVVDGRGVVMPRWYRGGFHVNLPDAPDGYAVMTAIEGRVELETVSRGLILGR